MEDLPDGEKKGLPVYFKNLMDIRTVQGKWIRCDGLWCKCVHLNHLLSLFWTVYVFSVESGFSFLSEQHVSRWKLQLFVFLLFHNSVRLLMDNMVDTGALSSHCCA